MRKCRILLWSPQGAGLHYSGAGKNAYRLYEHFDQESFSVSLAHGYSEHESIPLFEEQHYIADATKNTPLNLLRFLRCAKRWLKMNAQRFDVVHVLDVFEMSMRPAAYAKDLGLPVYVKIANSGTGFVNSGRLSRIMNLPKRRLEVAKRLDGLISISTTITSELKSLGISSEKIHAIPNGVDLERFDQADAVSKRRSREMLGLDTEKFTLLFVGEIVPRKQPHVILEMLEFAPELYECMQVIFLGPKNDNAYAALFAKQLKKLKPFVDLYYVEYSKRPEDFYHSADAFVLPSKNEGMSNAVLEAMATGLPIFSTPVSGNDELIYEGVNGGILQHGSEAVELASKLKQILASPERAVEMGAQSRKIVTDGFGLSSVAKKYMGLFANARRGFK